MSISTEIRATPLKLDVVRSRIEEMIRESRFPVGTRLPPERELAKSFGVSLHTLRGALALAEAEGMVLREQGRGTFVRSLAPVPTDMSGADALGVAIILVEDQPGPENVQRHIKSQFTSLEARLSKTGRHMVLAYTSPADLGSGVIPRAVVNGAVRGAILYGTVEDFHVEFLRRTGLPLVVLGNRPIRVPASQVRLDIAEAAYQMACALLSHVRPVYLLVASFAYHYSFDVQRGYSRACAEAGQDEDVTVLGMRSEGAPEVRRMIERSKGPFGLLLNSPAQAVLELYAESGMSFAEYPTAKFGVSDYLTAEQARRLNACDMGLDLSSAVALNLLDKQISGANTECVTLSPELICSDDGGRLQMQMKWHVPDGCLSEA